MPHLPLDPDEVCWTDEGQEFIYHNKLAAAVCRGDDETCEQLQDNYHSFEDQCLSTQSFANDQDPQGDFSPHGSRSKHLMTTKRYRTSLSSAHLHLQCATGKLSRQSS